jgi:hypothetical protein
MTFRVAPRLHTAAIVLSCVVLAAGCHTSPSTGATPAPPDNGWQFAAHETPHWEVPAIPQSGPVQGYALYIDVRVLVHPNAEPDMSSLHISGPGAEANRDRITGWLQNGTYTPTNKNPTRVAGFYHTEIVCTITQAQGDLCGGNGLRR